VRRHAKALFAGSIQGSGMRRGLFGLVCLCVLGLAAFLGGGASSAGAAEACPNEALRVGPSANLPNCRAYEMASPVNKEGQNIKHLGFLFDIFPVAAANGEASSYRTTGAINEAEPASAPLELTFLARRGAGGWSNEQLDPVLKSAPIVTFNIDFFEAFTPDLEQVLVEPSEETPLNPPGEEFTRHLFLRNNSTASFQLVSPGLPPELGGFPGSNGLRYQGVAADGSHVVFRSTHKLTGEGGAGPYLYDWSTASETLSVLDENALIARGGGSESFPHNVWHVVSDDGSRVFTTGGSCGVGACVYVSGSPQHIGGTFWFANSNGTIAYIIEGGELERYDVNADEKVNLTGALAPAVQGVLGASEDGSRVYFAAGGSLYEWSEGGGIEFIVTGLSSSNWSANTPTSRVSANGMHVAFNSTESLTGYPNAGHNEIYTYDAGSGELSCASCNPSGEPATSGASIPSPDFDNLSRNVSDSGQVFFDSKEALSPGDVNGNRTDVYEYDSASGETSLISNGASPYDSEFTDAGASGRDVFFLTNERLVGVDQDELVDLYDAREGGGLASQNPPPEQAPCTGEACHPEQSSPSLAGAASAGFVGKGNLSSKQNCNKLSKEAKKLSKRSKRLRKNANKAKKAGNSRRAKQLNKKANRLAKQARNKSKSAKKCRKRNRGASR
jgi:hypothetical protein